MAGIFGPLEFLLICLAGWLNQHERAINEYLRAENRIFREQLGKKRIRLTDDQRRRLAVLGKTLGRKALQEWGSIVTPDTIMRWYRKLIAMKWDYSARRGPGRPPVILLLRKLVVHMALENPRWGYDRIEGEIRKLGHRLSPTTVRNILRANGIEPSPERRTRTTWRQFLSANWDCPAAADFFTVEVCSWRGLVTYYLLFVMELSTRRVHVAGITRNPNTPWMMQMARNLTDPIDGFLVDKRFLIIDRDSKYCETFRHLLESSGVKPVRLPARSPNLNAYAERFVRTIKDECLSRLIFFSERSLRYAIDQYIEHDHEERPHQSLGNRPIGIQNDPRSPVKFAKCRSRLGGLLRSYERSAA